MSELQRIKSRLAELRAEKKKLLGKTNRYVTPDELAEIYAELKPISSEMQSLDETARLLMRTKQADAPDPKAAMAKSDSKLGVLKAAAPKIGAKMPLGKLGGTKPSSKLGSKLNAAKTSSKPASQNAGGLGKGRAPGKTKAPAPCAGRSIEPLYVGSSPQFKYRPLPKWVLAAPSEEFPSEAKAVLAVLLSVVDKQTGVVTNWATEALARMSGRSRTAFMRIVKVHLVGEGVLEVFGMATLSKSLRTLKKMPKNRYRFDKEALQELQKEVIHIPSELAERGDLTAGQLLVYSWLLYRAGARSSVRATVADIAAAVGLTKRSVRDCLRVLITKNLILRSGKTVHVLRWS